ncbi:hypothetical protein AWU67_11560 [Microterricola viridarii]|uniref:Cell wall binding repeat 2 n=1 Tax=Microterricola viridarii TaxID=412690 RepID=A0A109QY20_9MICO|nr:hypothetical protein AWU67_11560 [Microterricola viridarii]
MAVSVATMTVGAAAPLAFAEPAETPPGIEIAITGTLAVVVSELPDAGAPTVLLEAPGGAVLELQGVDPAEVRTGDQFSGVVTVDADLGAALDDLAEQVPDGEPEATSDDPSSTDPGGIDLDSTDPINADSALGQALLAQSMAAELPVEAVSSEVTPAADAPAAAAREQATAGVVPARAHTVDIAIVGQSVGATAYFTDAQVNALVAELSAYWASQSGGAIPQITRSTPIRRIAVGNPCDAKGVWAAAANAFGQPQPFQYYGSGQARHLVTIATPTPGDGCEAGSGLGSVGVGVHTGGLSWNAVAGPDAASIVGHELGHNFGLGHSNLHSCAGNTIVEGIPNGSGVYSNGCLDEEYADYYDIMSGGLSYCADRCYTTDKITALNVAHKSSLGFLNAASLANLSLPSSELSAAHTVTLRAASDTSGLRGIRLVNPQDGGVYFVEFRNGAGLDAGGLYTTPVGGGSGVRVLRLADGNAPSSRVLSPLPAAGGTRNQLLDSGETFTTANRGVSVSIASASASAVTLNVKLNKADSFSSVGDPRLSATTARFGTALTVTPGAASPAATGTTYQWRRNGSAIAGATSASYKPTLGDIGAKLSATVTLTRAGYVPSARTTPETSAVTGPAMQRVSGADRYATAVALSKLGYPDTAPVVYVATGANFPDALAAAPAAATQGGPLLLAATWGLPDPVKDEIRRLKPARIVVVGSSAVVSDTVMAQLKALQKNTVRLAGADRYATAQAIIDDAFPGTVGEGWLATGANFPDALSAAAVAGSRGVPVLLLDGSRPTVDRRTAALLDRLRPAKLAIAGSAGVVSSGIEAALKKSYAVTRQAGADRYTTSQALNATTFANPKVVYLATGTGFADALAGAAIAGTTAGPLYVIPGHCVPGAVVDKIAAWGTTRVVIIGGPSVLSPAVETLTRC